ncbi:MAG: DUF2889 domain-containing protein [Candidatus Helarchaeota archaeon]
MLKFCRTKFVGYEKVDDETFKVFGTLDDTIYSMKVDLIIKLPNLEISAIQGEMRRFTTPFCEEGKAFLKKAIGLKIEPGFQSKVKRLIARPGCRHFGNLINECCEAIIPALLTQTYRDRKFDDPSITFDTIIQDLSEKYPAIKNYCSGFSKILEEKSA